MPCDPQRIKELDYVIHWERTTPDLVPAVQYEGPFCTPHKVEQIRSLTDRICREVSPSIAVGVRKLSHSALLAESRAEIAEAEVKVAHVRYKDQIEGK